MPKQAEIRAAFIGALGTVIAATIAGLFALHVSSDPGVTTLNGVVMRSDSDAGKRSPLKEVVVTFLDDKEGTLSVKTDSNGLFTLRSVKTGQVLHLTFSKACFQEQNDVIGVVPDLPYTRYLWPDSKCKDPEITYLSLALESSTTFQVNNKGLAPCKKGQTCDPDNKWKATVTSGVLRAPVGGVFEGRMPECIAGPCPFSQIILDNATRGGPVIGATVRSWSDAVTYRLSSRLRFPDDLHGGPFRAEIKDRSFDFAIDPLHAEFLTIDARTADGQEFYLPVGQSSGSDLPSPFGDCHVSRGAMVTYQCTLAPDYAFSQELQDPPKPVRVDEQEQKGFLLNGPNPAYPPLARQARVQGTIRLSANIGSDGRVQSVSPIDPANDARRILEVAAENAVKEWIYKPRTGRTGQPVPVETTVSITFVLGG